MDDLRSSLRYGWCTLAASVPFWVAGATLGRLPAPLQALPYSALGVVVPAAAAVILARREGAWDDLRAQFRPARGRWAWWMAAATAGLAPVLLDGLRHGPWAPPEPSAVATLLALYVVGALGEEVGWTGFLQPRLLRLTGSVPATAGLLGAFWVVWHAIPYVQTGQPAWWIVAQSAQLLLTRSVIVGLSAGSGGGIWLAVLHHALDNLAWGMLPDGGAAYDPLVVDVLLLPIAAASLAAGARASSTGGRVGGGVPSKPWHGSGLRGGRTTTGTTCCTTGRVPPTGSGSTPPSSTPSS